MLKKHHAFFIFLVYLTLTPFSLSSVMYFFIRYISLVNYIFLFSIYHNPLYAKKKQYNTQQKTEITPHKKNIIRETAVAGSFYEDDPKKLTQSLASYSTIQNKMYIPCEDPLLIIVPHAGHIYSGHIAGAAYALVKNIKPTIIILVGPCHRKQFTGISLWDGDAWNNPLGKIIIDKEVITYIKTLEDKDFFNDIHVHDKEHSLEVHIPFLQYLWGNDITIVPILIRNFDDTSNLARILFTIKNKYRDKVFIVISSDFSHYYNKKTTKIMDDKVINAICTKDITLYEKLLESHESELCGDAAVLTALHFSLFYPNYHFTLIKQGDSSDYSGDKTSVVGYASLVLDKKDDKILTKNEQHAVLSASRNYLEHYLKTGKKEFHYFNDYCYEKPVALFVTLRKKNNELRGCIGTFDDTKSLKENLSEMILAAALNDSRFEPVTLKELKDITLEISLISPMKKISDINEIIVGLHGVKLEYGDTSAVYLPEVATEMGWDRRLLLESLSHDKAGLDKNMYKNPKTTLSLFTTQHF